MSGIYRPVNRPMSGIRRANRGLGRASGRRGLILLDLTSLLFLFALLLIFFVVLFPALFRARELAKRTVCAANLKGMGMGLFTYANEGNQGMPIAAHAKAEVPEKGKVKYAPKMIGKKRGQAGNPAAGESDENDTELSTTRNLWTLVRMGGSTPKSFICPSSNDLGNEEDNPQDFWDFAMYEQTSYGYQVPYGMRGRPGAGEDQRALLAAEKGPYGAALEAGKINPGVPRVTLQADARDWRAFNSPNHRQEGQNVLFGDSHVEFMSKPTVGVKNDNIYTRWSNGTGKEGDDEFGPRIHGTPPTSNETPWSDTDSLIYP